MGMGNATVHVSEPSVGSHAFIAVDEGSLTASLDEFVTETYNHEGSLRFGSARLDSDARSRASPPPVTGLSSSGLELLERSTYHGSRVR
jgi:hypothetical protein